MEKTVKLSEKETIQLTLDARLVGIRWDIIPWSLVFDLDVPTSESKNAPMCRAWIVFSGMSELSFPLNSARLPNGCWLTSNLSYKLLPDGFRDYSVLGLVPMFDAEQLIEKNPSGEFSSF
jgi:hypothetical protein